MRGSAFHVEAKAWLDRLLLSGIEVRLSWLGIVAFVRISTNSRLYAAPLTQGEALRLMDELLRLPNAGVLEAGPNHLRLFAEACRSANASGNLVTDAHYASLAMEHNCIPAFQ